MKEKEDYVYIVYKNGSIAFITQDEELSIKEFNIGDKTSNRIERRIMDSGRYAGCYHRVTPLDKITGWNKEGYFGL